MLWTYGPFFPVRANGEAHALPPSARKKGAITWTHFCKVPGIKVAGLRGSFLRFPPIGPGDPRQGICTLQQNPPHAQAACVTFCFVKPVRRASRVAEHSDRAPRSHSYVASRKGARSASKMQSCWLDNASEMQSCWLDKPAYPNFLSRAHVRHAGLTTGSLHHTRWAHGAREGLWLEQFVTYSSHSY